MSETKKQTWLNSLAVYKDIRMARILLLGAISGFPWVLIASSLSLWLKEEGLSRSTIGCCLLYTSPSPRDISGSRMPSSA